MFLALVGLGGSYWIYQNKDVVMEKLKESVRGLSPQLADLFGWRERSGRTYRVGSGQISSSSNGGVYDGVSSKPTDSSQLREARMKRFAVLDDSGNVLSPLDSVTENEDWATSADNSDITSEVGPLPSLNLHTKED